MDILHLVDRLEELFNNSRPIPLSRSVVVDENAFMDIIDQMRRQKQTNSLSKPAGKPAKPNWTLTATWWKP